MTKNIYFRCDRHENIIETYEDRYQALADTTRGDKVYRVRLSDHVETDDFVQLSFPKLRRDHFQATFDTMAA